MWRRARAADAAMRSPCGVPQVLVLPVRADRAEVASRSSAVLARRVAADRSGQGTT